MGCLFSFCLSWSQQVTSCLACDGLRVFKIWYMFCICPKLQQRRRDWSQRRGRDGGTFQAFFRKVSVTFLNCPSEWLGARLRGAASVQGCGRPIVEESHRSIRSRLMCFF